MYFFIISFTTKLLTAGLSNFGKNKIHIKAWHWYQDF